MIHNQFFENEKISKLFFKIAVPGAIGMLFSAIYAVIDGIYVSNFLGEVAFAAFNLMFPYFFILISIADLIGVGSSVNIAIALGKKENEKANRLFTASVLLILGLETLVAIITYLIAPYIIQAMGAEGELFDLSLEYFRTYCACLPFISLFFAIDNYLRICGKVKTSMFINITTSLIIVMLEYLFLGVFGWGIFASALACSISLFVCTILAVIKFARGKLALKFTKPKFNFKEVVSIFKNGGATFINNISGRLMGIVFNVLLLQMAGQNGLNSYGVIMNISEFIIPLMYGTCDSLQPATSYNLGAGKIDRVKKIQKMAFLSSFVICIISFILLISIPGNFINIFMSNDNTDTLIMAKTALIIYSFTYLTKWVSYAGQAFFAAIEKPVESTIISISIALIAPLTLIGCFYPLGVNGIWLNFPISALIVAVETIIIILILHKRKKLYVSSDCNDFKNLS